VAAARLKAWKDLAMRRKLSAAACALVLIWAGWAALGKQLPAPSLIVPTAVDVVELLPPPPGSGSLQASSELETVLRVQGARSEADVKRAKDENHLTPGAFQTVLGSSFSAAKYPAVFELLLDAEKDARAFVNKGKEYFARPRPIEADSRVQPVIDTGRERCYPSGHATRGAMWAAILCEIAPGEKQALVARGQEIGWDRVVAGVHFPTDVYAGQVLGKALARSMLGNEKFRERLKSAKREFEGRR
jgi:acid phosphatase (class A)